MRGLAPLRALGLMLMTLLALAFASASFGRPAPSVADLQLEAMQLAGLGGGELCATGDGEHAHRAECSLCHLIGATSLPDVELRLIDLEQRIVATLVLPRIRRAEAHVRDPAVPLRGPPATA